MPHTHPPPAARGRPPLPAPLAHAKLSRQERIPTPAHRPSAACALSCLRRGRPPSAGVLAASAALRPIQLRPRPARPACCSGWSLIPQEAHPATSPGAARLSHAPSAAPAKAVRTTSSIGRLALPPPVRPPSSSPWRGRCSGNSPSLRDRLQNTCSKKASVTGNAGSAWL